MKVSIAMATYNGAQYLAAQLQSFSDQTRPPDELIITDDCSSDETESIVRRFIEEAPFTVEFHRNDRNLGYCGNFNAALMKTSGDLVFLSDQDDVWFPEKIKHMVGLAEEHPDALVLMNDAALTDSDLNEVGLTKLGQIRSAGIPLERFVMGCCACVRRELLDLCLPIPGGLRGHDDWVVGLAGSLNAKFVEPKTLQYYRRHESNESQFIANRTSRVTRSQAFFHSVQVALKKDAPERVRANVDQLKIFMRGVQDIEQRAPVKYQRELMEYRESIQARIETEERRIDVRRKWIVPRALGVLYLLVNGSYRQSNGMKSALRDLVG